MAQIDIHQYSTLVKGSNQSKSVFFKLVRIIVISIDCNFFLLPAHTPMQYNAMKRNFHHKSRDVCSGRSYQFPLLLNSLNVR